MGTPRLSQSVPFSLIVEAAERSAALLELVAIRTILARHGSSGARAGGRTIRKSFVGTPRLSQSVQFLLIMEAAERSAA